VVHQRPGHSGTFGDLVDADLVIGPLAENVGPKREQLSAAILGR
jgi:hypothetical protein